MKKIVFALLIGCITMLHATGGDIEFCQLHPDSPICGNNGIDGIDGVDGIDGIDGVDAIDGIDGIDGLTTIIHQYNELDLTLYYDELEKQTELIKDMMKSGMDIQAGLMATGAIDFSADHKGHSLGLGFGTGNTFDGYRAVAGALGYQYGWEYKEKDLSVVVKSWLGKNRAYGIGFGGVIGF